jgi:hypothetical protein
MSLKRTEEELEWDIPLLPSEHVSDVLLRYLRAGRGAPRLVFKKRIFVPEFEKLAEDLRNADAGNPDNTSTSKAMSTIELFQAIDDFSTGALPFDKVSSTMHIYVSVVQMGAPYLPYRLNCEMSFQSVQKRRFRRPGPYGKMGAYPTHVHCVLTDCTLATYQFYVL